MSLEPIRPLVLVTGASSGIGRALAQVFAENGFDLLITAEDEDGLAQAATKLRTTCQAEVATVTANLLDIDGVELVWRALADLGRPLDVLAANAGIGTGGAFAETSLAAELKTVGLNVVATTHLLKLAVEDMARRGEGRILITGSIAGLGPAPFQAVYGATKAYLNQLGEAIREELRETGVSVTVLMPGPTDTEFFERAHMEDTPIGRSDGKADPAKVARQGWSAMLRGASGVTTGFMNKVQSSLAGVVPATVLARLHRQMAEPEEAGGKR
jgi:uncharacterized protein